jgi:ABC-type glutathione transport system ATPase component
VPQLLRIRDLKVRFRDCATAAVAGLDLDLSEGETIGVLGESGAGKTTLARCIIQMLPAGQAEIEGSIVFRGLDLLLASEPVRRTIRGAKIALISQEPELGLNPVIRVGEQVAEVLRAHANVNKQQRKEAVEAMLTAVGLKDREIWLAYPHQLSGGQRQRVVIAQALVSKPALLIADEPTSALDNLVQSEILHLLRELKRHLNLAVLFITHDPALLTGLADRVLVMYAGSIVETGSLQQIWSAAQHPYTASLVKSFPALPVALT